MAELKVCVRNVGSKEEYQGRLEGVEQGQVTEELADVCFTSFAERAQEDSRLNPDEATALSFKVEPKEENNPDSAVIAGKRIREYADRLIADLERDDQLKEVNEGVIGKCIIRKERTAEGGGGNDEPDALLEGIDFQQVKNHLFGVFGCLITREDLARSAQIGSANVVVIRLASGIAYCYNFSVQLIRAVLGTLLSPRAIDWLFRIIGVLLSYLMSLGIKYVLNKLGGWTGIANYVKPIIEQGADKVKEIVPAKYLYAGVGFFLIAFAVYKHITG